MIPAQRSPIRQALAHLKDKISKYFFSGMFMTCDKVMDVTGSGILGWTEFKKNQVCFAPTERILSSYNSAFYPHFGSPNYLVSPSFVFQMSRVQHLCLA